VTTALDVLQRRTQQDRGLLGWFAAASTFSTVYARSSGSGVPGNRHPQVQAGITYSDWGAKAGQSIAEEAIILPFGRFPLRIASAQLRKKLLARTTGAVRLTQLIVSNNHAG
jgi:hypothetical protein